MLNQKEFPILEFDNNTVAKLEPNKKNRNVGKISLPERCVITFFKSVIESKVNKGELVEITTIDSEALDIPIYKTKCNDMEICIVNGCLGAAGAAYELEQLIALGCKKIIVCGGAGVLKKIFQ